MKLYQAPPLPTYSEEKCTNELDHILKTSKKVGVLLKGIQTLNKDALKRGITCRSCINTTQDGQMGYYDGAYKRVVICSDHIRTREELEHTVIHELTHAFDSLRKGKFKSICHLIACGEVRASALGQCSDIKPEREKYKCIWNDAMRSTEIHCGTENSKKVLKEVFANCVKDKAPF
ncbi:peptidase M76 [Sporodiniella umbellata]|nr:peptidase M76 [Sporodiniella umbellata]